MKFYYLIQISYIGLDYFGWQKQKDFPTIQGEIEKALISICGSEKIKTFGASRTDSKVSALSNFLRACLPKDFDMEELKLLMNSQLPREIRVLNVKPTHKHYLVSKESKAKEYIYQFSLKKIDHDFIESSIENLDIEKMKSACSLFIGEHSFHNFQYRGTTKNKVRTILQCEILKTPLSKYTVENENIFALKIKANGFLKQMVRIIMGTLFEVGQGLITEEQIKDSLKVDSNLKLGHIASGHALFLHYIEYD
jgi:tRNA pseudouridine38-40 synthase